MHSRNEREREEERAFTTQMAGARVPSSLWQKAVCLLPSPCRGAEIQRTRNLWMSPLTLLLRLYRSSRTVQLPPRTRPAVLPMLSISVVSWERKGQHTPRLSVIVFQRAAAQTLSTARAGREWDWATPLCWILAIQQADGTLSPRKKWVAKVVIDYTSNSILFSPRGRNRQHHWSRIKWEGGNVAEILLAAVF